MQNSVSNISSIDLSLDATLSIQCLRLYLVRVLETERERHSCVYCILKLPKKKKLKMMETEMKTRNLFAS